MYIFGDIGNSETKVFLVNSKNKIIRNTNFSSKKMNDKVLNQKFRYLVRDFKSINKILFCSVVPKSFNLIKKFLSKKIKKRCYEIKDLKLRQLINIKVNFKQVGSDRLTNAISLLNKKDNFIILDFGTATTFDVVLRNRYKGGIIAPGVNLSLKTLIEKAKLIPNTKLKKIKNIIGKNTQNAVRSGFYWGYQGLIENIINLIKKKYKKEFKIIFTGGLAHLYKNTIQKKVQVDKDLTIKGLFKLIDKI